MKNVQKLVFLISVFLIGMGWTIQPNSNEATEKLGGAYLTIAGKFGGDLTIKEVSEHTHIGVAGCAEGSKIFTYVMTIHAGKQKHKFKGTNDNINSSAHQILCNLKPGDWFEFDKVKAYLPDGKSKVDVVARKFKVVKS